MSTTRSKSAKPITAGYAEKLTLYEKLEKGQRREAAQRSAGVSPAGSAASRR